MESTKIKKFTDLEAWQLGYELSLNIYEITKGFRQDERYGLTSQMRRAAVSVTSNVAEGFARHSKKEKIQFYAIARGSVIELQSQILLAKGLGIMSQSDFLANQCERIAKIIYALMGGAQSHIPKAKYHIPYSEDEH